MRPSIQYSRQRQEGVVIVVALFFVAIAVTLAYFMMARLERDTRRTTLLLRDTQAELLAEGSIAWAQEQLLKNLAEQKPNQPIDMLPMRSPVNEVNGFKVSSTIYDAQSRLNINNQNVEPELKRLIQLVAPEITEQQADEIVLAVVDWVSPVQRQNEYSKYYQGLSPPYSAAHHPMVSVSELQLVRGITPALYQKLAPYIIALPTVTPVNIRTAMAPVLAALSTTMTLDTGAELEKIRTQTVIPTIDAFLKLDIVKNHAMPPEKVTVQSQYFLVESEVTIENQRVVLYTLLDRSGGNGKKGISIVWQSKNVPG